MTTLHLGDCLNGCDVCKNNYHEGKNNCEDCGYNG